MDRLSIYLTIVVGALVTGTLVTIVLILGWYSWPAIAAAAAVGMIVTWPASYAISRRIKRMDSDWDDSKADRAQGIIPDPKAPEV